MTLIVIPIDKYNLFCDCDFVNFFENKKYIHRKSFSNFSKKKKTKTKTKTKKITQ